MRLKYATCALFTALIAGGLSTSSLAQGPADLFTYKTDVTTIVPAASFIQEPEATGWSLLQPIVLHSASTSSAIQARRTFRQVRMFRLARGSRDPKPWFVIGRCEIYRTSVIQVEQQGTAQRNAIPLNSFDDPAWLSPNVLTGKMDEGRFLLVFEEGDEASGVFRLAKDAHDAYFKFGWVLRLTEDRPYTAQEVKDAHERLERPRPEMEKEAQQNSPTRVCHRVKNTQVTDNAASRTDLVACDDGADEATQR